MQPSTLTPSQIAAFDQVSGLKTNTNVNPVQAQTSNARYNEIMNIQKKPAPAPAAPTGPDWQNLPVNSQGDTSNGFKNFGNALVDEAKGAAKGAVRDVQNLGKGVMGLAGVDTTNAGIPDSTLAPKSQSEVMGDALSQAGQIAGGVDAAIDAVPKIASKAAELAGNVFGESKNASSIISYINSDGEKVFTKLKPSELDAVKNEIGTIPEGTADKSQIHLDAIDTNDKNPDLSKFGTEVSRKDFISGHADAPGVFKNMETAMGKGATAKELSSIQENIAPKLNKTETEAAINQGRVTRGKESFLFGKQPDTVVPSDQIVQSSQTIQRTIPNAAKMNDVELSSAINDKTSDLATKLRPQMQATPLNSDSIENATGKWNSLKAEQQTSPEFLDHEAGNKQFQNKFENYFKQAQDGKNLDDVWQARIDYDNSIPKNVKTATEASSPQLQTRRAMWLDNRGILNSVIHDSASGLGDTSQKAFSDMSDLYSAKQNILSKAKIDTKGAAAGAKIGGFIAKHPYVSTAVGLGVADKAIKDVTGLGY